MSLYRIALGDAQKFKLSPGLGALGCNGVLKSFRVVVL